jgi:hypothetical protein
MNTPGSHTAREARLAKAIEDVLAHVEDMDLKRVNNQCTLCFSHRKMLREALADDEVSK